MDRKALCIAFSVSHASESMAHLSTVLESNLRVGGSRLSQATLQGFYFTSHTYICADTCPEDVFAMPAGHLKDGMMLQCSTGELLAGAALVHHDDKFHLLAACCPLRVKKPPLESFAPN